ncbi:P-loop containing nucleoside triphosphate hydrolase protein [Epithele typhae]|uniref:P-loop containing nucleoside triphosphate hydrolase protein n=1 Tax=Epithele typhae TaxID=378194 RepID=UPI0020075872|nr:P-loop containing nucleoside triphosphate hydrolase protein [Epithele typhae]KAH9933177.1 P-loop containing nucleoside triphosphate hydrolase protein [Epithele typhae]
MSSSPENADVTMQDPMPATVHTRAYQQELLEESLHRNIVIALDTGSGKTHIAVLRMKHEAEHEPRKVSWFIAPTVALVEQQYQVIKTAIPVSVGQVSGASEPNQWKDAHLWRQILSSHRIMVTTPQVLLDALHHGYVIMGLDIGLIVFDEAHHAIGKHPYNMIMKNHYHDLPRRGTIQDPNSLVRPMVLGLTASPTYGSNVEAAFRDLEMNLDCTIRSTRHNRGELAQYVHRPEFKHYTYLSPVHTWDGCPSVNYQALKAVIDTLNIEDDPYVISLRSRLTKLQPGDDRRRIDQQLSKAIDKEDTFTHKGLRDFARAAEDICMDLGTWAADWYVAKVIERAKLAANPYNNIMSNWQEKEKRYLLGILNRVAVVRPSSDIEVIINELTHKMRTLVDHLVEEETIFRSVDEDYSGIIFVTRRDTVIVLAELLRRIPETEQLFRVGCLLGSSNSFKRHSFLDITRSIIEESQADILRDFKIGDKNLIVSTSVAEEGIDIQACGSVVRFDVPPNVVSWAQSRGRARRRRSSFVILFEELGPQDVVRKWEDTERQLMAAYNDPSRALESVEEEVDGMDGYQDFEVASTGALLTIDSAIPHLNHFCAVIPAGGQDSHVPLYELDPPDYVEGWHALAPMERQVDPYLGPWGATVNLPRALPVHLRKFTVDRIFRTKRRAQQSVAFKAYVELYRAGLINNHLLPLSSVIEPEKGDDVKAMLAEVAKREGLTRVSTQLDPWRTKDSTSWFAHRLAVKSLPELQIFTREPLPTFIQEHLPTLYIPGRRELSMSVVAVSSEPVADEDVKRARQWTQRLFSRIYGSRMERDKDDFSYLFLPAPSWREDDWDERRSWQEARIAHGETAFNETRATANAAVFGATFGHPDGLGLVRGMKKFDKPLRLLRWQHEPLSMEEEERLREEYTDSDFIVRYPLMVVRTLPKRRNFLIPFPPESVDKRIDRPADEVPFLLDPYQTLVELASPEEIHYTLLLPSILRWLQMALTVNDMCRELFVDSPVAQTPLSLLTTATTAPAAQEHFNYQRLETLGDTVLKFVVSQQLYAQYPFWHEGYLSRKKDHTVANSSLARAAVKSGLYKWIVRDRFVPRKWKPHYISDAETPPLIEPAETAEQVPMEHAEESKGKKKSKKKAEDLSTKMLADVVESLIGAAYKHGGFDTAIDCVEKFDLGITWKKLPARLEEMHKVDDIEDIPEQLALVEQMIGYKFHRRTFLVQALTHASYQGESAAMSLERLEFLGDSALDMVVVDYLYHAAGKNYSPGYMHIKKEAVVNSHILAYFCLNTSLAVEASMPMWTPTGGLTSVDDTQRVYLWQCLMHSSHRVLEDHNVTFLRYQKRGAAIARALEEDAVYPWAALTSLQAPKFLSDMVESLLGAVYIDTHGDLDARVVHEDVDSLHPVSRLGIWAAKQKPRKKVEYVLEKVRGKVSCSVKVDGEEVIREETSYRSKISQDEVRFRAAERANAVVNAQDITVDDAFLSDDDDDTFVVPEMDVVEDGLEED